jgi:hypothetical protein
MPISDLPTTNFRQPYTALGRFPGYHQEDQGYADMMLQQDRLGADAAAQKSAFENARALEGLRQAGDTQRAQIAANAQLGAARMGTLGDRLQQQRFGQMFPLLSGQLSQMGQFGRVGGQSGPSPNIKVGGVWNGNQIQQQVNATRANNDAALAAQQQAMQSKMAGRGFGANSPLAQALGTSMQNANLAANTGAEREIRWDAASGNAEHLLNSQVAREQQFATRMDEDIRRRQTQMQGYSALLAALSGLV